MRRFPLPERCQASIGQKRKLRNAGGGVFRQQPLQAAALKAVTSVGQRNCPNIACSTF